VEKPRILIVEDQWIVAEDAAATLAQSGYEVVGVCESGEEAVAVALERAPDLMLVDIRLRGAMDGIETVHRVKARHDLAVVFLTAHSESEMFERAMGTQPEGYLYKPVSPTELTRTVEIALYKHRMDKKLKESEQRYRTLVEDSFDGIFVRDGDRIVFANSRLHEMLGYGPGELIGKERSIIYHPQGVTTFLGGERVGDWEKSFTDRCEVKLLSKTGGLLEVEIREKPVVFEGAQCVQVWVRDVTSRKRAEEDLRILGEAIEQSHDGIAVVDNSGNIVLVNRSFAGMHGYAPEELKGKHLSVFHTREQMPEVEAANRLIRETGGFKGEIMHAHRDGTTFSALMHNSLLRDRDGAPIGIIGTMRDISELKMAQERLRIEKLRFQSLVEHAPFGLVIIESDGSFSYANPKYSEMFGYSLEDTPNGREWFRKAFPDPVRRHEVIASWIKDRREAVDGKQASRIFPVRRRDGEERIIHFRPALLPSGATLLTFEDITDRVRAEERLRQSEEDYRRIIENLHDAFYRADMNGVFTFLSPASARVAGYTPEEGVGNPISMFYAVPAEREEFMKLMRKQGFVNDFQARLRHKDGHIVWVSTSARFIKDKDGNVVGTEGISRDITDRKLAEEKLREREALIRSISDSLPSGMIYQVVRTPNGGRRFTYLSQGVRELYGYTPEQALNDAGLIYGRVLPEDRERLFQAEEAAFASMSDFRAEARMTNASGDIRWYYFASSPRPLEDGSTCWSGIALDITERKKTEEALRESEQLYRGVIENIQDVYYRSNAEGKLVMASPSGAKYFGYERVEDMIGIDLADLWAEPDGRKKFIEAIRTHGKVTDYEGVLKRKDGTTFVASFSTGFYTDETGQVLGTEGIMRDISERKRIEAQLLQSRKLEAIGTLAGAVAHECNNLLQVALGHTDLLRMRETLDERWAASVEAIRRVTLHGARLVRGILTFSLNNDPERRPLNLNDEVRKMEELLRPSIPPTIDVQLRLEEPLRLIEADSSQLQLVLLNLAMNARDAMPNGGRLIIDTAHETLSEGYCRAHPEVVPGDYVMLSVSDTGHGMDQTTLDRIFEPFFTTKAPGKGSGLGLSIAYGAVKAHGGFITCYSEKGVGTTFKMFFPVPVDALHADHATTLEMPVGGTETLLLVDDDHAVRTLAAEMVEMTGYTALSASNGREALEVYRAHRDSISLVILDLAMPEMDGRECLAELLKINPDVKVVIASGFCEEGPNARPDEPGVAGFLSKPFDVKRMLTTIRQVLDHGKS
jgi:PAS domain S-box-containing protein